MTATMNRGCGGPVVAGDFSLANLIRKCGKGVKLAQDLTEAEATAAILQILDDEALPAQAGALLIALRMKSETVAETIGVVRALRSRAERLTHDFPILLELASAHDGKTKSLPLSPFVAMMVAAAGIPVILTGGENVPTKKGVTSRHIFAALGVPVRGNTDVVRERLQKSGVAYWDVQDYCPQLVALNDLRASLGLRTVFNTAEKAINPGAATHVCTGVFHGPYLHDLAVTHKALGTAHVLCAQATEASTDLPLKKRVLCRRVDGALISEQFEINPDEVGMKREANPSFRQMHATAADEDGATLQSLDFQALAHDTVQQVYDAVAEQGGLVYDALVYNAAVQLFFVGRTGTILEGLKMAQETIASGKMTHLLEGLKKS